MNLEPTALNYLLEISFYLIKVDLKTMLSFTYFDNFIKFIIIIINLFYLNLHFFYLIQ